MEVQEEVHLTRVTRDFRMQERNQIMQGNKVVVKSLSLSQKFNPQMQTGTEQNRNRLPAYLMGI